MAVWGTLTKGKQVNNDSLTVRFGPRSTTENAPGVFQEQLGRYCQMTWKDLQLVDLSQTATGTYPVYGYEIVVPAHSQILRWSYIVTTSATDSGAGTATFCVNTMLVDGTSPTELNLGSVSPTTATLVANYGRHQFTAITSTLMVDVGATNCIIVPAWKTLAFTGGVIDMMIDYTIPSL